MSVTRLAFKLDNGSNYIDIAKALSQYQRTLVRQKQNFTILGGQIVDNSDLTAKISTAPNTWYVRAAVNRCFKAWKDQRARTLAESGLDGDQQNVGKYADFKISLNGNSLSNTVAPIFTSDPTGPLAPLAGVNEYLGASVLNETAPAAGSEKHFKILGDHTSTYYSATKGWIETRALPNSSFEPTMPDYDGDGTDDYKTDFLNNLNHTEDGNPERLHLIYEDNNHTPFAFQQLYGDMDDNFNLQLQALIVMNGTAGGNTSQMIAGFKALCGLLHVHIDAGSGPVLFLDVLNTPEAF